MKKLSVLLITLLLMTGLFAGCGGSSESDDPTVGHYTATAVEYSGIALSMEEFGDIELNLKNNGKGKLTFDGSSDSLTWERTDSDISIDIDGVVCDGSVTDSSILFENFLNMGAAVLFEKDTE